MSARQHAGDSRDSIRLLAIVARRRGGALPPLSMPLHRPLAVHLSGCTPFAALRFLVGIPLSGLPDAVRCHGGHAPAQPLPAQAAGGGGGANRSLYGESSRARQPAESYMHGAQRIQARCHSADGPQQSARTAWRAPATRAGGMGKAGHGHAAVRSRALAKAGMTAAAGAGACAGRTA
jgi:hypothetical protein